MSHRHLLETRLGSVVPLDKWDEQRPVKAKIGCGLVSTAQPIEG
jgi:hypothetical protein